MADKYVCGGVSAPHFLASKAGARILAAGGTALEAAVTTAATLAVVYPHMNSIGGDSFWLVKKKGESPVAVCACGQAAAKANVAWYGSLGLDAVPSRGSLAALTVPGTVRGWSQLLDLCDQPRKLSLRQLLSPAIEYACEGFAVSAGQVRTTASAVGMLKDCPGFARTFLKSDGTCFAPGERLRQPALGRTLTRLADDGLEDFYEGEVAERMCRELTALGSPLTKEDFKQCAARLVEPLQLKAFGHTFYNLPEPTQGVASLAILGLLERIGVHPADTVAFIHAAVESTKLAFAWRNRYVEDPTFMKCSTRDFLSDESLDALFERFDARAAARYDQRQASGDTVWFGVADKDGTIVSGIQSLYWEYGSGVVLGDTGVTMQNRGCAFTFDERQANCLRPGAVPFHTLNPAMVITNDRRVIAYGTMGGEGQPQTQAAVILRHLFGMPLDRALAEPRWLMGRTWGETTAKLRLESRFSADDVRQLRSLGHDVEVLGEPWSDVMGHAGAVSLDSDGRVTGASDPRCDGSFETEREFFSEKNEKDLHSSDRVDTMRSAFETKRAK